MADFKRPSITTEQFLQVIEKVKKQVLHYAEVKGPQAVVSSHEISGLIKEETDEFFVEVQENNIDGIEEELLDVAVTAVWGLASMEVTDIMDSWTQNND
jgi:hypothetical protein